MPDLIWKRRHVMSLSLWEKSCATSINFQNLYSSTFSFYCRINSLRHINMFLLITLLVKCIVWSLKCNLFSSTFYIMDPFCFSVCHKKKLKLQLYAEFCKCQSWYSFCITGKYFSSENNNNFLKVMRTFSKHLYPFTCVTLCNIQEIFGDEVYSQTCTYGHLSNTTIFLVDSPYIHSCFNLSTMATFFGPQGGRCREVQLSTKLCSNPGAQLLLLGN